MDRQSVWQATKAQLYLTERLYVKRIVGRDSIQRNKVALRELRCLQEILSDLHSSSRSVSPSRLSAIEAAASSWHELQAMSTTRGVAPDELCDVPPDVRQFFQAGHATSSGRRAQCGSETGATSTRAPSTALELDEVRSLGTDCHSEHMAHIDGFVTCPSSRTASEQLDHLARELREQLDQEHTSLLASIEEVQGLMEAEVVAPRTLPSFSALSLFVDAVEQLREKSGNAGTLHVHDPPAEASPAYTERGELPPDLVPAQVVREPSATTSSVKNPRPRWADLSDSDKEGITPSRPCLAPRAPDEAPRTHRQRAASQQSAEVQRSGSCDVPRAPCQASQQSAKVQRSGSRDAPRAPCQACGEVLARSAFSRRAWRRARSAVAPAGCGDADAESGTCLACTGRL